MPTGPTVAVVVLSYNHRRYIRACLQSIVDQKTSFPFEVIVADDCSTDGTRAIVMEFRERYSEIIKPILRPSNIGGTNNFIDAHNAANTRYVAHIDGDDIMLPDKLQKQAAFLDANPEFSVVWHKVNLFDDNGGFVDGMNYDSSVFPSGVVTLEHALRLGTVAAHSSMMYRRSARKTKRTDFETLDLFYAWEYLSAGKGKILDEVLGGYRVSAEGSAQLNNAAKIQRLVAHHARFYLKLMPEQKRSIFVLALINFLVDATNLRSTAGSFAKVAIESASFVSPRLVLRTISEMRRIPPGSPLASL